MYELISVGKNSFYIECPAKIGIVRQNEKDVCLIDSGNHKDTAKKVRQILDANGWHLTAIFNTHSHADHIGGNAYLQAQTGCKIYAAESECDYIRHPILEPTYLIGAFAPKELHNKFLLAQPSEVEVLTDAVLPEGMQAIPLPGHCGDQLGFRTKDDVVYLADCLSGEETLQKYQINFLYDVESYLQTLESVKQMQGACFVPSHAAHTDNIAPLAQKNIDKVQEIAARILQHCKTPQNFEALLGNLFSDYALTLSFQQYALVGSTVRSYLSWLKDRGELEYLIENNLLLWKTV